jgi:hypothetical protein
VTLLDCVPREYNACSGHQRWWPLDIPLCTACIRAHDNAVLDVDVLAYPSERRRLGVEVVDRYVEETLNLTGMEIHCDDVVATGGLEHIGHEFRCNGRTYGKFGITAVMRRADAVLHALIMISSSMSASLMSPGGVDCKMNTALW